MPKGVYERKPGVYPRTPRALKDTPRRRAKAAGEKTYIGTPCKKCGRTTRLVWSGNCKACANAYKPTYYERYKDKVRSSQRRYEQKEEVKARRLEYASKGNKIRRARELAAGGKHTTEQWQQLKQYYGNRCVCCGRSDVRIHRDHVVPICRGGSNDISNIQPLCPDCNKRKGRKTIDYRPTATRFNAAPN